MLDTSAVEKVQVKANDQEVAFDGIRLRIATHFLEETEFQELPAGQSITVTIDVAQAHDLSSGGIYKVLASGAFSFAEEGSTELVGSVAYESNHLWVDVDGEAAAASHDTHHSHEAYPSHDAQHSHDARRSHSEKRSTIQNDCAGYKMGVSQSGLRNCADMARRAQQAATWGSAEKLVEYFKSSSDHVRQTVSDVFGRVAAECDTNNPGVSKLHCSDVMGACRTNVLAYTSPTDALMVYCDLYFQVLPATTMACHEQDQATTDIHEATHLYQIKGTLDYGGYGYDFVRSLPGEKNLNHADTYALYANAIWSGC
ncbi:Neutral protease 2 -like protein [Escovopsis weberi]|uniref:Neutral protease 2 n=1 Tax=Escovopsis weberi TaxID=150374 RepID=A0A0N0RSX3_ESCWE|nr:Neutral protease 2 -like protein [Escovopsis weberi]